MDMRVDGIETRKKARAPKGRKDEEGQEQPIKLDPVRERIQQLITLHHSAKEASADFSDAIKKCAEDSGLNAAAVRRFVIARAGDKFDARKKDVAQLSILFEDVGA